MIKEILTEVDQRKGEEFAHKTNIDRSKIPPALTTISSTVMKKAKSYIDDGKVMELKDIFTSGDDNAKQNFMNEIKEIIRGNLETEHQINRDSALHLTELSIPEIITVAKEKLLGADGKVGLADFPRLLSFFKSEGKEVKSGGLGGLFGM